MEETVGSSTDSKAALILEESKSGWVGGPAKNDDSKALSEANDLDN